MCDSRHRSRSDGRQVLRLLSVRFLDECFNEEELQRSGVNAGCYGHVAIDSGSAVHVDLVETRVVEFILVTFKKGCDAIPPRVEADTEKTGYSK